MRETNKKEIVAANIYIGTAQSLGSPPPKMSAQDNYNKQYGIYAQNKYLSLYLTDFGATRSAP